MPGFSRSKADGEAGRARSREGQSSRAEGVAGGLGRALWRCRAGVALGDHPQRGERRSG